MNIKIGLSYFMTFIVVTLTFIWIVGVPTSNSAAAEPTMRLLDECEAPDCPLGPSFPLGCCPGCDRECRNYCRVWDDWWCCTEDCDAEYEFGTPEHLECGERCGVETGYDDALGIYNDCCEAQDEPQN